MPLIQLLAVAAAIAGPQATQNPVPPFPDVPADHWAYPAVESLRQKGILRGYPDSNFRGKRTITRYELSDALERALSNPKGIVGIDDSGALGPQGPIGPRGPKGERGPQGPPGPNGVAPADVDELLQFLRSAPPQLDRLHHKLDSTQKRTDDLEANVRDARKH